MIICYGIKNSHEPNFFNPIINHFSKQGHKGVVIARDYIEVQSLLRQLNIPFISIGKHYGGNPLMKLYGLIINDLANAIKAPKFDVSISFANTYLIHATKIRNKKAVTFTDNDISFNLRTYNKLVDYLITPTAISVEKLKRRGCRLDKLYQFDGFKEDVYIADYKPDKNFLQKIPFNNFVAIRPESIKAHYISSKTKSLVPSLFKLFEKNKINVLFLPRYKSDINYARDFKHVFIPESPLNGLDVCYYSDAVLTGAGTFAREAAVMGTPAVSFFPGKKLLAVDRKLIDAGLMFHSRNVNEIFDYVTNVNKVRFNTSRSKLVQLEVFSILERILREIKL